MQTLLVLSMLIAIWLNRESDRESWCSGSNSRDSFVNANRGEPEPKRGTLKWAAVNIDE